MFRMRGLAAAMSALVIVPAAAQVPDPEVQVLDTEVRVLDTEVQVLDPEVQVLDSEMTMRPIAISAADRPATVRELLALPGRKLLAVPEAASDVARERSSDGLARVNENRMVAAEGRGRALQRARERRSAVVRIAAEARERRMDFSAEVAEAARGVRESLVRGSGMGLPIPISLPGLPEHVPAIPMRPAGPALPD